MSVFFSQFGEESSPSALVVLAEVSAVLAYCRASDRGGDVCGGLVFAALSPTAMQGDFMSAFRWSAEAQSQGPLGRLPERAVSVRGREGSRRAPKVRESPRRPHTPRPAACSPCARLPGRRRPRCGLWQGPAGSGGGLAALLLAQAALLRGVPGQPVGGHPAQGSAAQDVRVGTVALQVSRRKASSLPIGGSVRAGTASGEAQPRREKPCCGGSPETREGCVGRAPGSSGQLEPAAGAAHPFPERATARAGS